MYPALKTLHMSLAAVTLGGFLLRAWWMSSGSGHLHNRLVRVLPHVIDSAFLLSGIGLIYALNLPLLKSPWLLAKLAALVAYIVFGTIALKRGRSPLIRHAALLLALLIFAYIVGVAISKSPASWLAVG
ncbi:MAG: SirB2 family protein [Gammaproteobacteria bacterium]|nr:SirB2 family protein [Gammaproteobacteria bacterium]